MIHSKLVQLVCLALLVNGQFNPPNNEIASRDEKASTEWGYPTAPSDPNASDEYFGTQVKDPYRPLKYPFDSKTLKYIKESNDFTDKFFQLDKTRDQVKQTLLSMYSYEHTSSTITKNGTTYQLYNPGINSQAILTKSVGDGPRATLLDPRSLYEKDLTKIYSYSLSSSGTYLAYSLNRKGSDWQGIFVLNPTNGERLKDEVLWAKFNSDIQWESDNSGFYYSRYEQPPGLSWDEAGLENNLAVYLGYYFHKIGTSQSEDVIVEDEDVKRDSVGGERKLHVVNKRFILIITEPSAPSEGRGSSGAQAKLIDKLGSRSDQRFALTGDGSNYIEYISSDDNGMYFITDVGARNRHLVKVPFNSIDKYDVIVPEIEDGMIYQSITSGSKRVNFYYWDGISHITYTKNSYSKPEEIKILFGDAYSPSFNSDGNILTFKLTSFLYVYQTYEYNFDSKQLTLKGTNKGPGFNGDDYTQYLTHYKAKDGQDIPILIAHRKGLKPDKTHPGFLYGYGGFNIQLHPSYRANWAYLMKEKDFVIAIALIRGGGERGKPWWEAAVQLKKPLSYSDFSDAVDFLHNDPKYGFIGSKKLFINGGSNGGLLTAATCNMVPDKLGGCLSDIGVHDLLRYQDWTVGDGWKNDYGLSNSTKAQFDVHMKISPLQNVLPTSNGSYGKVYPPYLINTANYDDRVSPVHSLKLAATIQNLHKKSPNPVLLYIALNSGHSPSNFPKYLDSYMNQITMINLTLKKNNR